MVKIDWNKIEKSNALILKENETIRIVFLDNGNHEFYEIIDKRTNEIKEVDKYIFKVLDLSTNKEKEFSTLAMTLMNLLKIYTPLKDKKVSINKFRTGLTDFDINFEVKLIE